MHLCKNASDDDELKDPLRRGERERCTMNVHSKLYSISVLMNKISLVLGGAATCSKGFVICFLNVPLTCLGSMAIAVQPNSLGTHRKHFTKPTEQVAAPASKPGGKLKCGPLTRSTNVVFVDMRSIVS